MLDFPQATIFGRRIPKEKFYSRLDVNTALRALFVSQVDAVVWQNKLSAQTLGAAAGQNVVEIDVLEIQLKQKECDEHMLRWMDENLPHHIVFVLRYGNEARIVLHYKKRAQAEGRFQISATGGTSWMPAAELHLQISGLNLDRIYENFFLQVGGSALAETDPELPMGERIAQAHEREKAEKQIATLIAKIRSEKQFNRQVELNRELKRLKEAMENSHE